MNNKIKKFLLLLPISVLLFGCKRLNDVTTTKPNTNPDVTTKDNTNNNPNTDDDKITYQINYELNGGENSSENPSSFEEGKKVLLEPATKPGYDFLGWSTNAKGTSFVSEIDLDMNWTVYAIYSIHNYSINYHNINGLNNQNPDSYNINDDNIKLVNIDNPHIDFLGWYDSNDNPITEVDTSALKDYDVYAKYNLIKDMPTVLISGNDLTYNKENQNLITASVDGGTIYYSLDGENYSESIPTGLNAGTYTVYYKVIGDATHNDVDERTLDVTIKKAKYDMSTISFNDMTVTYDGNNHKLSVTGAIPTGIKSITYSNNSHKDAGTYDVTVAFEGDSLNYELVPNMTAKLTIEKANITNVEIVGYNEMYDGLTHDAVVSKTATTVNSQTLTWTYGLDEGNITEDTILVKDIADSKTYYFKVSAPNHNDYIGHFDVTITDKNVTNIEITNLDSLNKDYNGEAIETPTINTNSNGAVTITYSSDSINFTSDKPVNAGNYIVKVEIAETTTYASASIQKAFTINKATPVVYDQISVIYNELSGKSFFTTNMNVSDITFDGSFTTSGVIAYSDSKTTLQIGNVSYSYTFTPTDLSNYNPVTKKINILVYATINYYDDNELVDTMYVAKNGNATNKNLPEKDGYSLEGWTLLNSDSLFDFATEIKANTNLYSKYSLAEYAIEYHLTGGTLTNPIETYTIETDSFYLPIPKQTNKQFIGWTGTGLSEATMNVLIAKGSKGNRSYTAKWADLETVAYYLNNTSKTFTSIEEALNSAVSGDIVCVIAPTDNNYHSANNNVASTSKKTYYITSDCEIKSGVSFVIPTDEAHINSVSSSSDLATYINSMKTDSNAKANGEINTYGTFAKVNADKYLRVTVEIASGVTLTNNGTLVVSGYVSGGTSNGGMFGQTSHSYSQIILNQDAKIVQNNSSAKTYCFGYISEKTLNNNSSVDFEKGTLYIPFIVCDYRGFSYSWAMTDGAIDNNGCSAFNQFEFRNIDALAKFSYSSNVIGVLNTYVNYPSQSVNENFYNELNILGNSTSYVFQLTNSTYSSLTYKYNTSTGVADINIYGGMTLNNLSLSLSKSIVTVNLSTTKGYFPISWRQNIKLLAANGQTSATFNASKQSIKLLPGASLEIDSNVSFSGKNVVVYTAFGDGSNYNGPSSACGYGQTYPLKPGAILQINDGATASFTSLAGNVYYDNASVTATNSTITSYEPWVLGNSGGITPPWTIKDFLEIRESLQKTPISYRTTKQKLYLGVNTYKLYNSYMPSYKVTINSTDYTVSTYQKTIFVDSITTYKATLVSNISKCLYGNATYYAKNSTVTYNPNAPYFIAVNSTVSISSNKSGVNEFDVQSLSIDCTTPTVGGNYPLYPGTTINLEAIITDATKAYDKAVTWTSSNTNIATVSNGKVTGVALGSVTITATCDGKTATIKLNVIEEQQLDQIESIYITDNNGASSLVIKGTNSDGDKEYNGGNYSNGTNVTVTVNINPSTATYSSIVWTFTASAVGRQYVNDNTVQVETIENQKSVVIHVVSGSGASDDTFNIKCTVTDLNGQTFSATFVMSHKADTTCFAKGTLVTLADGSQKKIEELLPTDKILVFNNFTGLYEEGSIAAIVNHGEALYDIIKLTFSDDTTLKFITDHGLFDVDLNKYVSITEETYANYIGHKFLQYDSITNENKIVTLVNAEMIQEITESWSLFSTVHMNHVINNMLGITTGLPGFSNLYEFGSNYKYDEESMNNDIETYGLYTYDDWKDYISEDIFNAFGFAYIKANVEKGIASREEIITFINWFYELVSQNSMWTN